MNQARFFKNSRGNKQLIDPNNYIYTHNKTRDTGITYWKCADYKNCRAYAVLDRHGNFVKVPEHSHGSNIAGLQAKLQGLDAIKKARLNPNKRPRQVLAELANQQSSVQVQLAQRSEAGLTRAIQRVWAKEREEPTIPKTFADLFNGPFPDKYSKASDGSNFLLMKDFVDENSDKAFVIFLSSFGVQLLKMAKLWLSDGTFFTAPAPFAQIYFICGLSLSGRVLLAAYCLLPNKETKTYSRVWEAVKVTLCDDGDDVFPEVMKMDFEAAACLAFRSSFPMSRVSGCLFHLKRNLWDTIGKKHCTSLYNTNPDFQTIVDSMASLAYVRQDKVVEYYNGVIEPLVQKLSDTVPEVAFDYIDYFERTYVGRHNGRMGLRRAPLFKPGVWSIYQELVDDQPTTNNNLEAFNSQWNAARLPSDNFWTVLERFRQEDALARKRYMKDLAEVRSPESEKKRKVMWRHKMQQLHDLAVDFEKHQPKEYLVAVNLIVKGK